MSKSKGNVVSPDEYVTKYGADSIRCYLMFLGPWDQGGEWSDSGLTGVVRWMNRLYEIVLRDAKMLEKNIPNKESEQSLNRTLHQTIKRVSEDLEKFKFNTAIAALMEFSNALNNHWNNHQIGVESWSTSIKDLVVMLAPFAPHLAEELWEKTANKYSVHSQRFPEWDPELVKEDTFNLVIQINGKVRDKVLADATIDENQAKEIALNRDNVSKYIDGKSIRRSIYIQKKLINIVVDG
jgi:leucyl-tRNA synthetase